MVARWSLALGVFALLLFFFSPSWAAFALWSRVPEMGAMIEVRRGVSVLQQIAHPGAPIEDPLHAAIQWRLLFPWIGRALHLPAGVFFGLAHVGCVVVLGCVIGLLRRQGASLATAGLAAIMLGASGWFFATTGWLGYFDAWVVLGLLIVAFGERSWRLWTACVWAPWVDERFVVALPLALACRWLAADEAGRRTLRRDATIALVLAAAFVALRLGVLRSSAGATPGGYLAGLKLGDSLLPRVLFGWWEGLRAGWLFVGAAVLLLWRRDRGAAMGLAAGTVLVAAIGVGTAQDFGRALMLLTPVAVLGAIGLVRANAVWPRVALPACAAATLLLPAHHVMSDRVTPIYYVYHALAAFENPPPIAMAEMAELRAIRAMQEGRFAVAEEELAKAIKLARNPATAARQRGVLRASQGRWREAAEDFALMAKHEPANPDAWFMCAQASFALNHAAEAQRHWAQAKQLAPAEWITRPDVARFRAKVEGK